MTYVAQTIPAAKFAADETSPNGPATTSPLSTCERKFCLAEWLCAALICVAAITFQAVRTHMLTAPAAADETHFIPTSILFAQNFSLNFLKHYEEMSGPVPFWIFAAWGTLIHSFDPGRLRIISVILGFSTGMMIFSLLRACASRGWHALLAMAVIAFNPYFRALSTTVYTDMATLFFMITAIHAMVYSRPILFAVAAAAMLASRQYQVFFVMAAGIFYLARIHRHRLPRDWRMLAAVVISGVPLAALCLLWHGINPDNQMQLLYIEGKLVFHPDTMFFYIAIAAAYLLPLVVLRWRWFFLDRVLLIASILPAIIYWVVPRSVSKAAVNAGYTARGVLDGHLVPHGHFIELLGVFVFVLLGLPMILFFIRDLFLRFRAGTVDIAMFLDVAIVFFLMVQPLSYLTWEKYIMPALPLIALRLMLPAKPATISSGDGKPIAFAIA